MGDNHIVPQVMIREFANHKGELLELHKPSLSLATKWKRPKGILFCKDYYKDLLGDLDEDLLKRIEQKFSKHYSDLIDLSEPLRITDARIGAALIDWLACLVSRTSLVAAQCIQVAKKSSPSLEKVVACQINTFRLGWFDRVRDWMTRADWRWGQMNANAGRFFVLTDNPAIMSRVEGFPGFYLIAPITDKRVIVGGLQEGVRAFKKASVDRVNASLAGWAERTIFSSSKKELERLLEVLKRDNLTAERARKPFFGHLEEIQSMADPTTENVERFWLELTDGYGQKLF